MSGTKDISWDITMMENKMEACTRLILMIETLISWLVLWLELIYLKTNSMLNVTFLTPSLPTIGSNTLQRMSEVSAFKFFFNSFFIKYLLRSNWAWQLQALREHWTEKQLFFTLRLLSISLISQVFILRLL